VLLLLAVLGVDRRRAANDAAPGTKLMNAQGLETFSRNPEKQVCGVRLVKEGLQEHYNG
jgi:hypothetical protein